MDQKKPRTGGNRGGVIHPNTRSESTPTRAAQATAGAVNLDDARAALACIPPDLPRDEWVRMLMAARAAGLSEADARAWSAAGDSFNERDFRDTWRSLKADGAIKAGTLFFVAQQHGYQRDPSAPRPPPPTAAELADRQARTAAEAAEQQARADAAALDARQRLAVADPADPQHPYLRRKGVSPTADMRQEGSALLVPVVGPDGAVRGVQVIDSGGNKRFSRGTSAVGALWWARAPAADHDGALYVVEGVATGLTVAAAVPDAAVAVPLSAGNVPGVATALRERWPDADIIIAADADKAGRDAAAKATGADPRISVRLPVFPPGATLDGQAPTDFNDLHQLAGLDEVRRQLLDDARADPPVPADPPPDRPPLRGLPEIFEYGGGEFIVGAAGVFYRPPPDAKGVPSPERWLCSRLDVLAITCNADDMDWGWLVEWRSRRGAAHRWVIPAELLAGDGAEVRRELARGGVAIASGRTAHELLSAYLINHPQQAHAWCVSTTGWHRGVYVTPHTVYGTPADGVPVVLQHGGLPSTAPAVAGTLADWQQHVAALAVGNSRLLLVVAAGFAGALLDLLGVEGGGLHLRGGSSTGKSTALLAGASVFGDPAEVVRSWRSTAAGLEGIAARHNDSALLLDEMGETDPRQAGETAYLLANGRGKQRSSPTGTARPIQTWRLLLISTGELSLAAHMATAGRRPAAGQELRIADIEADAGAGHGLFEDLHGHPHARALSDAIRDAAARYHGTAGPAWLDYLTRDRQATADTARAALGAFVASVLDQAGHPSAQAGRMARRFGAVAVAGELATRAGITGWPNGAATHAARVCFDAWLDGFGRAPAEERAVIDGVREFLERFGSSRFRELGHAGHIVPNLAGYYRAEGDERTFLFTRSGLADACRGVEFARAARVLVERGWITAADNGQPSRFFRPAGMPSVRLYQMTDAWAADE